MSEFLRIYRERVEAELAPVRRLAGDESQPVRTALRLLSIAEEVERDLHDLRVGTQEASERTGWHPETLQRWAKARLAGEDVPAAWANLTVEGPPYVFVLGTIPGKQDTAA